MGKPGNFGPIPGGNPAISWNAPGIIGDTILPFFPKGTSIMTAETGLHSQLGTGYNGPCHGKIL